MKILFFAGSLRAKSFNKNYVRAAHQILSQEPEVEAELIDLLDFPLPVYNQDIQDREFPSACLQFSAKVAASDAIVISTPEYNGSISCVLKNTVDWSSRLPQNPWLGKHVFLMGASPGALGAVRGLWHSRRPFEVLGAFVYPEMLGLPKAGEAFDDQGILKDSERLTKTLKNFYRFAKR